MKPKAAWITIITMGLLVGVTATPAMAVPDLSLHWEGGPQTVSPGETVNATLDVANLSAEEAVNGVQARMHYDPTLLTLTGITANADVGTGWSEAEESNINGDIMYGVTMISGAVSADHTVATLSFTAIAEGTTNITFRPDNPPFVTKLTVASDSSTIQPNTIDSGNLTVSSPPRVSGLELFYTGRFGDEADTSRYFLAAGSTATVDNVTNYLGGITGIRVFFDESVVFATTPDAAFSFEWTNYNGTTFSPVAEADTAISVSAVTEGSGTVVTVIIDDDHVQQRWLKVTIDAAQVSSSGVELDGELSGNPVQLPSGNNARGGNAVFYLGNMAGDVDGDLRTLLTDCGIIVQQEDPATPVPVDNLYDVDKDGVVLFDDAQGARYEVNPFLFLPLISP